MALETFLAGREIVGQGSAAGGRRSDANGHFVLARALARRMGSDSKGYRTSWDRSLPRNSSLAFQAFVGIGVALYVGHGGQIPGA